MPTRNRPSYEDYDPSNFPDITPDWYEPAEDRSWVQPTRSWLEVAEDFAPKLDMTQAELLCVLEHTLEPYRDGGGPSFHTNPDEEEACWAVHQVWLARNKNHYNT